MPAYTQNDQYCHEAAIGEAGLNASEFAEAAGAAATAAGRLADEWRLGGHVFLDMPRRQAELKAALSQAEAVFEDCDRLVVVGIGGSSLGARALHALAPPRRSGVGGIGLAFLENIDTSAADPLAGVSPEDTGFLVVSKSGTTAETLANFLALWGVLARSHAEAEITRRVAVIVQPGDSPLRRLADRFDLTVIDHDPDLPGRYSALSPVGLVPAHFAGLDVAAVRRGAGAVADAFAGNPEDAAPTRGAALQVAFMRGRDFRASVMVPYVDRLAPFARWWGQIWGESIGKQGFGTMPYPAVGAVDQHSQLQLWLDGPADKLFTAIAPCPGRDEPGIDTLGEAALAYLEGRTRADLIRAEYRATVETLAHHGSPVRTITLDDGLDEAALGALMMHFMIETAVAGYMLGIEPFDQPAVDEGKALARKYLSEAG